MCVLLIARLLRGVGRWARKPVNYTSWVAVVTPTDRPKSVRNRCLIELFFVALFVLSLCPLDISVAVGVFVIGLDQIPSFLSWKLYPRNSCSLLPLNNILLILKYIMVGTVNLFNSITPLQKNIKVTADSRDFLAEYFKKSACGYVKKCSLIWDKNFNMFEVQFYQYTASKLACCKILISNFPALLSFITYLDCFYL